MEQFEHAADVYLEPERKKARSLVYASQVALHRGPYRSAHGLAAEARKTGAGEPSEKAALGIMALAAAFLGR